MILVCKCGKRFEADSSREGRDRRIGAPLYCSRECHWESRRIHKPLDQKKEEKRLYDAKRREELRDELSAKSRESFRINYAKPEFRAKMADYRRRRMPYHVEYCRKPEYRAKKHEYDIQSAMAEYGDFGEAWRMLIELEGEIRRRATAYERRVMNGYYLRSAQSRRRELWLRTKTTR